MDADASLKNDPPSSERDERLAEILNDMSDRASRGQSVDLAAEEKAHPELAEELRELWAAVMLADAVGSNLSRTSDSTPTPQRESISFELPYRFGDYELLEEIGRGGMGIVFRAQQLSLNREVAVKLMLRGKWASASDRLRFQAEAEAAAKLDHPNIVPVYEVGEHDDHTYFSMKYITGQTLSQRLAADGPMDPRMAARIIVLVARAVEFAHQQGVLHRDLKPSNIMLDSQGQPHVTDFGLAKQIADPHSLTRTGAVLGTPAYMAPEQAAGDRGQVGPASDTYSLGTILYHLLTGKPPFEATSPVDVVLKVLEQDPPLLRTVNPSVDRDLEMIALRCLQKPPDLRYESAGALANDAEAYLNDEPISARSGRITHVVSRLFRETHHATVLENWGLLWMWHALVLLTVSVLTNALYWLNDENRIHYFLLWTAGLGTWATVFWLLRSRMGPVTFVERQIAHVWASSMIGIALLFPMEYLLGLGVLTLSPILGLTSGMVFLIKAGILSGTFYLQAVALFVASIAMAAFPHFAHVIFGVVSALCFFLPGWKYYQQRIERERRLEVAA